MNEYKLPKEYNWELAHEKIAPAGGYTPPYKVYTALLTQTGTDAPIATVLENTIGGIIWSYEALGVYSANLLNAFTINKTFVNISNTVKYAADGSILYSWVTADSTVSQIIIQTQDASLDDVLYNTPIEIRVYN